MRRIPSAFVSVVVAVALVFVTVAACGGGGGKPSYPAATTATSTSAAVPVPASQWTDTKLDVATMDVLGITATGSWTDGDTTSGPSGAANPWPDNFFNLADLGACMYCARTATSQWGALIGYIGSSPPAPGSYTSTTVRQRALRVFYVGEKYEARALASGRLWLAKNADAYSNHTVDNRGQVAATITVSPPESAGQSATRARLAAASVNALEPLQETVNSCVRAILDAARDTLVSAALETLIGGEHLYDGATIIGDTVSINYELGNGQVGSATFDVGRVVFTIVGYIPLPGFELFGIIGGPALDCTEAGFWYTGQLGGQLGQLIRQKLQPPTTVAASIQGTWTLTRAVPTTCINFPDGCFRSAIHIRLDHCTDTQCVMSRADGIWQGSHTITRQGTMWAADFQDIGVMCKSQQNVAEIVIRLSVTSTYTRNGILSAESLGGTYEVKAAANPPNCSSNARATYALYGSRL